MKIDRRSRYARVEAGVTFDRLIPALAEGEGTQRTARLCNDLVDEHKLVKAVNKKVVYFALAE